MIHIQTFTFNPFAENTTVLFHDTGDSFVIDPGCYEKSEEEELKGFIESKNLKVKAIINTHCHIDHVLGVGFVSKEYNVPFLIHKDEMPVLKAVPAYAPNYGFEKYYHVEPNAFYGNKDLELGGESLEVRHIPGHAPGHTVLINHREKWVIGGDVLFQRSIGRTDLPGGNHDLLITSIRERLFDLPDDYVVYPGHGPTTTIGEEKRYNPFVAIR